MANVVKELLAAGQVPTGVLMVSPGGETVQTLGSAGFNFVLIDQMYGSITWSDAAEMSRAARLAGMTPLVRLPSEPWVLSNNRDHLAINAARAFSVGMQGVMFDVNTPSEVEAVVEVALGRGGWHREMQTTSWTVETFDEVVAGFRDDTLIGVTIESDEGLRNLEAIVSVDGVNFVTVSLTDLALTLGDGVDSEGESIVRAFRHVKEVCAQNGVALCANTGMAYGALPDMRARAKKLLDDGVDMLIFQTSALLLQGAGRFVLEEVHGKTPQADSSTGVDT